MILLGSPNKKIPREQVFYKLKAWVRDLLDEYDECVVCGGVDELEPHHLIICDKSDNLYYSKDNGVVVCHRCHNLYHNNYAEVSPYTFLKFYGEYSYKLKKRRLTKEKK